MAMGGLSTLSEAFTVIHGMYHESTTCHVLTDLCACLNMITAMLSLAKQCSDSAEKKCE